MVFNTQINQEDIFIPPPNVPFRILSYVTQKVLVSRTHAEPQVFHHPVAEPFPDQLFTLLHGTGDHSGLYAIKSQHTGMVLFSRSDRQEPRVGHIEGNGQYNDNWFKIEPGKGQYAKFFRLITPSEGMALFSRTHLEPQVYNISAGTIYSDHRFTFLFDDMQVDKVDFDLDAGRILSSSPIVLAEQTLTNKTSQEQEMSFSVDKSVTNTSTFEESFGIAIKGGLEFSTGLPFIAEGKWTIEISTEKTFTWGESESVTVKYTSTFPVKAAPHETVHAIAMVNQGIIEVPYTMHLHSKSTGGTAEAKGIWHGATTWDLRYTVETVKPEKAK